MLTRSILIAALLVSFSGFFTSAYSVFHSGGVGTCGGCHVSHTTEGSFSSLLLASDTGSVCLNCHAGPGGSNVPSIFSFDGSALTPGGDFYWLTKIFSWLGGSSPAARHGHNVVALDFGLGIDPNKAMSPGGSYPAAQLSCISCHDPHGRSQGGTADGGRAISVSGSYGQLPDAGSASGSYRLLGGVNYTANGYSFSYPAPVARQNSSQPFAESDSSHIDYGSGMSEWCANCHQGVMTGGHKAGSSSFEHPVGAAVILGPTMVSTYNSYKRTGDLTGTIDTAYLQFVPIERGIASPALLDPTSIRGADGNARLSCLTCHRAHASAFRASGRWDFTATMLVDSHPAIGDSGASGSDVSNSYYDRDIAVEFGAGQGPFCEKCHANSTP